MSESIIFQCDFCGARSEEEPMDWPRQRHCRVELVVPDRRFIVAPHTVEPVLYEAAATLPLAPVFPGPVGAAFPPAAFPMPLPIPVADGVEELGAVVPESEVRWVATLCDQCIRRIGGLFDLKLETPEEITARHERERAAAPTFPRGDKSGSMRAEMVKHFPSGPVPNRGGLIDQFPTPGHAYEAHAPYPASTSDNSFPSVPLGKNGEPSEDVSEAIPASPASSSVASSASSKK